VTHKIDILLATLNGAPFLQEQLVSIQQQSYKAWRLLVGDDGSTDFTLQILRNLARQAPETILLESENPLPLGACQNFSFLLEKSTSAYVMFCDQDDVWLPDKISSTFAAMKSAERQYGVSTPLLVHTDLQVVDKQLQTIAPSFFQYQQISPNLDCQLHRLLPQNAVTGCTIMANRPLVNLATPIPKEAMMHDWWLALVASVFGHIIYINKATIFYRQHGMNSVGSTRWGLKRMIMKLLTPNQTKNMILRSIHQANVFLNRYSKQIPFPQRALIEAYATLPYMSKTKRIQTIFKYRFFYHGTVRTYGFLANLLLITRAGK
jgi:glycosyltransferase involved in cell wall biosynthesis